MRLGIFSLLLLIFSLPASAVEVRETTDLQALSKLSMKKRVPVILYFSAHDCPYCMMLEEEILKPMLISGDYGKKVIIRKIMIDGNDVVDFNGKNVSVEKISSRYNVFVTPTMVFIGPNGQELAKRMIGINTVEMFGGDVDDNIDKSLKKLRHWFKSRDKLARRSPQN